MGQEDSVTDRLQHLQLRPINGLVTAMHVLPSRGQSCLLCETACPCVIPQRCGWHESDQNESQRAINAGVAAGAVSAGEVFHLPEMRTATESDG